MLSFLLLILKFRFQYIEHLVDGAFLKVGFVDYLLAWHVEDGFCRGAADAFEGVDNPAVDFVAEFIKINVVAVLCEAVNVDLVAGQHCGKLDVQTAFSDGKRHLFRKQHHLGALLFLVDAD